MLKVVERSPAGEESGELLPLDEIARVGARRMLMAALATEAADYVERHRDERDSEGRALVVHNGRAKARKLTLGAGTVELKVPRVNDAPPTRTGSACSAAIPVYEEIQQRLRVRPRPAA